MRRLDADRRDQARRRRARPERIAPLELWDLAVGGATLFEARAAADFPARVGEAIAQIRNGTARRRSGERLDERARRIELVFVGGGGATRRGMAEGMARGGLPLVVNGDGAFVGETGGWALLDEDVKGLVVDLGQSAIKVSWRGGRLRAARDFLRLAMGGDAGVGRERLRHFAAVAIARAVERAGTIEAVVLALPSELDDDLCPGESSYAGMGDDRALCGDILERAGLGRASALVLNDGELAAVTARAQVPAGATALVLTIGFGVGGALVLP